MSELEELLGGGIVNLIQTYLEIAFPITDGLISRCSSIPMVYEAD